MNFQISNTLLSVYKSYLSTPRLDWQNILRKPTRANIFKAMCQIHHQKDQDHTALNLIEQTLLEKNNIWFWSDQHFFHKNIIQYASRPYENMDQMNQDMINNYYEKIKENDLVIFGGDVSFASVDETKHFLKNLPGKKILILGNHDFDKNKITFKEYNIFDATVMCLEIKKQCLDKEILLWITHYPIVKELLPENVINVHGHTHQHTMSNKHINISVEHTQYGPQNIDIRIKESLSQLKP